jgi:hypothetical protein
MFFNTTKTNSQPRQHQNKDCSDINRSGASKETTNPCQPGFFSFSNSTISGPLEAEAA